MKYLKLFEEFSLIKEHVHPGRFRYADAQDVIDFVEELLYEKQGLDITEKMAGQHLTVTIKNNQVGVSTKDQIDSGAPPKHARHSTWGLDITGPLMKYMEKTPLPDQIWAFEVLSPRSNHDYIRYKHYDKIFAEYTGNLKDEIAAELRKDLPEDIRLLTKKDIKIKVNKNEDFENFKKMWEGGLKAEFELMKTAGRDHYKIGQLKEFLGSLLEKIVVSVIDKASPIEGVVIGTSNPLKLQTNNFLKVQRIQMPVYSLFKTNRYEIKLIMENPTVPFEELKEKHDLSLSAIYSNKRQYSLYDTIKYYLEQNKSLGDIDTFKYRRWLSPEQSEDLLRRLTKENTAEIYQEIYNLAR